MGSKSAMGVDGSIRLAARWGAMDVNIGTAGWSIARTDAAQFPAEGSALERYAARFPVVEINSSFHRPHQHSTWARWSASVPADFRFAAKLPKQISHQRKLVDCDQLLDDFLGEVAGLGGKLGVLLLQLPPRHDFQPQVSGKFLRMLADRAPAPVACEPRHSSWMEDGVDALLGDLKIARVAADPPINDAGARPGGWAGLRYWRLHGSPVMYRSSYSDRIADFATAITAAGAEAQQSWCLFDNTASSAATGDALALQRRLAEAW